MALSQQSPLIQLVNISKKFPGVLAVNTVSLDIFPGEVHVVAGENGAGKSTLMKLLSQVERPTSGTVVLNGQEVHFVNPQHAQRLGISMVYQEFALAPHLTIAQNIVLGRESTRFGAINHRAEVEQARQLLQRVGLHIDPKRLVSTLSVAEQQMVEIAKALDVEAKLVIMDEPTATLTEREIAHLFAVIRGLTDQGIAVLYISHRLDEIFQIADRVTVMRDGKVVATLPRSEVDQQKLIRLMVGRDIHNLYPKPEPKIGPVMLRVEGITRRGVLHQCSFEVRAGEILGFAGLVGSGRTELARAVFGADPIDAGSIWLEGKRLSIQSPASAIAAGIGYLTEDRKRDGLAMTLDIAQNITLTNLPTVASWIDLGKEERIAVRARDRLKIRTPSLHRKVTVLSGGNQQKVIVARWLETQARVLFFDEPSRGIDVNAKAEIFELIGSLASEGRAIVMISSYLPELLNMCDRLVVMREGRIAGELQRSEFTEERVMALATGASEGETL
ncbi:MAG TPA: sugar ABC transporter ATP-binding protein [Ktedonobacterales bacterium]|nr:sugar ABC transporter ATP-binding protein [Ktedonobacterales bacterium]